MITCLVFGNGYICKSLIDQYKNDIKFVIIDHSLYDVLNPDYNLIESYIKLNSNNKIDVIIDSICPILPTTKYSEDNIKLLAKTIHHVYYINNLLIKLGIKQLVYLSSAGIIYDKKNYNEALSYNNINTLYGLLKIQSECTYKYFSDINTDISYKILRISNVYGNIKYHSSNSNGIINILLKNYLLNNQTDITLNNSVKNYIYVKDLCTLIYKIMLFNFEHKFEIINTGSIYDYSIEDIINIIQSKYKLNINYNKNIIYNDNQYYIDINKIKNIFTDVKFNSLENIINTKNINDI